MGAMAGDLGFLSAGSIETIPEAYLAQGHGLQASCPNTPPNLTAATFVNGMWTVEYVLRLGFVVQG